MSKSSKFFVNNQELEARVQRKGYQRDRQSLEARRLLNGNYLVVGVTGESLFLAETKDGRFHRRNGRNVVKIHQSWSRAFSFEQIADVERLIDTKLQRDKNRLSNGNYLILQPGADDRFCVAETKTDVFAGQEAENFVKFHTVRHFYLDPVRGQGRDIWVLWREAQAVHAAIMSEDARRALAVAKRNERRRAARAMKKASAA